MKQARSTALYAHPFCRGYWRDAAAELKHLNIMVLAALFVALRIALKSLEITIIPGQLYISVGFFVNALGAMIYGPVVAVLGAIVSDTLGFLVQQQGGMYFAPFVLTEIGSSLVFALFLYRRRLTAARVILARFCVNFFINILLQTPIMWLYYKVVLGKSYSIFHLPRFIKNLALFPLEAVLLVLFLSVLAPLVYRVHLTWDKGEALKLHRKLAVLLACLTVAGAACVAGYYVYDYNTANHASRLDSAAVAEINAAVTEEAQAAGLLSDGQIAVIDKVYKKLRGDSTVEFKVYDTSADTDLDKAAGYLHKTAKGDGSLTLAAEGSAVLTDGSAEAVTALQVHAAKK